VNQIMTSNSSTGFTHRSSARLRLGAAKIIAVAIVSGSLFGTSAAIAGGDSSAVLGMSGSNVRGMSGSNVRGMSGSNVRGMSGSNVRGMSGSNVRGMSGSNVRGMSGSNVRGMSGSNVRGMSGSNVRGMSGSNVRGMSGSNVRGMSGSNVLGMSGSNVRRMIPETFGAGYAAAAMGPVSYIGASPDGQATIAVAGVPFVANGDEGFAVGDYVVVASTDGVRASVSYSLGQSYVAGVSPVRVKGVVSDVDAALGTLDIAGGLTVDYTAQLSARPTLAAGGGDTVVVAGVLPTGAAGVLYTGPDAGDFTSAGDSARD
jgi:hypothetical protein